MVVQVYLEIPNGDKLAEALHSKVIMISMVYTRLSDGYHKRFGWPFEFGFRI